MFCFELYLPWSDTYCDAWGCDIEDALTNAGIYEDYEILHVEDYSVTE